MDKQKEKRLLEIKDELEEIVIKKLQENPELAEETLLEVLKGLLDEVENQEPLEMFIFAINTSNARKLIEFDMIREFLVYCSVIFEKVDQEMFNSFLKNVKRLMEKRCVEIEKEEKEEPNEPEKKIKLSEEEDEVVKKLLEEIEKLIKEDSDD